MLKAFLDRLAAAWGEPNVAAAVNVNRPNSTTQVVSVMTEHDERDTLEEQDVKEQDGEPLPERTQMSVLSPAIPGVMGPPVIAPEPVDGSEI